MGVENLWTLLNASGQRKNLSELSGQRLAIDVSIWVLHIIHGYLALGNKDFQNIHLTTILKRIYKLWQYNIKPVFVFDGKPPELKKNTLYERYKNRENRRLNLRKLAEKYIVKKIENKIKDESTGNIEENSISNLSDEEEFSNSLKIVDHELNWMLEKNPNLLKEYGYDDKIFFEYDFVKQNDILREIRQKEKEKTQIKLLQIEEKTQFSKVLLNEYLLELKKKHEIEEKKQKKLQEDQDKEKQIIIDREKEKFKGGSTVLEEYFKQIEEKKITMGKEGSKGYVIVKKEDKDIERLRNMALLIPKKQNKKAKEDKKKEILSKLEKFEENNQQNPNLIKNTNDNQINFQNSANKILNENNINNINNINFDSEIQNKEIIIPDNVQIEEINIIEPQFKEIKNFDLGIQDQNNKTPILSPLISPKRQINSPQKNASNFVDKSSIKTKINEDKKALLNFIQNSDLSQSIKFLSESPSLSKKKSPKKSDFVSIPQNQNPLPSQNILEEHSPFENLNSDTMNLYDLEQEYNKFININNFDSESLQSKFSSLKNLLQILGIPWVDSPGEAEAQCAYLEKIGLVDGIITEDSDVFLFGGQKIYRKLFKNEGYCDYFSSKQLEKNLGLNQDKLIFLALFLGSDYTLGVKGIGIVNAMEIVTAFDSIDGLHRFSKWAQCADVLLENKWEHYRNIPLKELQFKNFHKNFKKQWELPEDFPNLKVIEAYKEPNVDKSTEKFSWGNPDFEKLKEIMHSIFKWEKEKIDEYSHEMEKITKKNKDVNNQSKIDEFFKKDYETLATIQSKRLKLAVKTMQNNPPIEIDNEEEKKSEENNTLKRENEINDLSFYEFKRGKFD